MASSVTRSFKIKAVAGKQKENGSLCIPVSMLVACMHARTCSLGQSLTAEQETVDGTTECYPHCAHLGKTCTLM